MHNSVCYIVCTALFTGEWCKHALLFTVASRPNCSVVTKPWCRASVCFLNFPNTVYLSALLTPTGQNKRPCAQWAVCVTWGFPCNTRSMKAQSNRWAAFRIHYCRAGNICVWLAYDLIVPNLGQSTSLKVIFPEHGDIYIWTPVA